MEYDHVNQSYLPVIEITWQVSSLTAPEAADYN